MAAISPIITGVGLAVPVGNTVADAWAALCAGAGVVNHALVPGVESAGRPRVNTLALRVAREACTQARWNNQDLSSTALMLATSKGPVDAWLDRGGLTLLLENDCCYGLAEPAAFVASEMGIGGPRLTVSAACASGLQALIRGAIMIRAGEASRVLVVAAESSLHPLFLSSFERLGVIAPPGHGCRPFDNSRAGFVVSEAAAAVCLEAPNGLIAADAPPLKSKQERDALVAVDRFALGADATHLTSSDADGLVLRSVLARVSDRRPIDLVHAHGTGTRVNDPIELAAIESVVAKLSSDRPILYSHKGAIGHTLGAAGLISVVINVMAHRHGRVPPNVNTRDPLGTTSVSISQVPCDRPVTRSLAVAAGFGGAIAAVSLMTR